MSYAIPDEPRPTKLSHLVFQPSAPLLATMLCGAWLAWPWFVLNSIALGSPTRRKEIAGSIVAVVGTVVLALIVIALDDAGIITATWHVRLALLAISTWKLGIAYWVCLVQSRTFHVYQYYGGGARSALYVLIAGFYLRSVVMGVSDNPLWWIIVAGGL